MCRRNVTVCFYDVGAASCGERAERPRARAYLQKKILKKPLREDAGADVLRDTPCSAHVSG